MAQVYGSTVDRLLTPKGYLIWTARSRSDDAGMTGTAGRRGRRLRRRRHGRRAWLSPVRRPRARISKREAQKRRGAHHESLGEERGVRDELQTRCRRRRGSGERKRVRVRAWPGKTAPKCEMECTYGRGKIRRSFGWPWRRRSCSEGGGSHQRRWLSEAGRGGERKRGRLGVL